MKPAAGPGYCASFTWCVPAIFARRKTGCAAAAVGAAAAAGGDILKRYVCGGISINLMTVLLTVSAQMWIADILYI